MNRLRGRKKAKEEPLPRPSIDTQATQPSGAFNKMFGRSKKPIEEPKEEVDFTAALPASDDFRTSLLMTGLSARFSMLREQDDPSSKLGKAMDDSVLFPKRQSRMDFGLGSGLHDIAEDASIRAPFTRMDSFQSADDAASMTGSVMNRGKPTEGNNLFGGRQKIYKITAGGASGRTLYDDDVAQSAFQKWRASERDRPSFDEGPDRYDTLRPESPPDFSRRRETSSTTSSAPSAGRNSTAATSIASQPPSSLKDWQPPSATTPTSASQSQFPERSVTRTRRLYEQGLTQELENSQTSAKSRFDGLTKGRFSGRAGDLPHNSSSPTSINAPERLSERRAPIMSKSSAPNLRSFSPPTPAQPSPAESSSRFPNMDKTAQATSPPLSPPISESEEHPMMSIGANDQGKATAMGFFNRPVQQYDENRYAQRQRQLQQGRDSPTSHYRPESNGSAPTTRSRSSSSLNRTTYERTDSAIRTEPTVREEPTSSSFLDIDDDEDEQPASQRSAFGGQAPQVTRARPADHEHPAFRQSALPTPLSLSSRTSEDDNAKPAESPEDSPTLGPGSGLSGMVRQHLRNVSNASSNYGPQGQDDDIDDHYNTGNTHNMDLGMGANSNPWGDDHQVNHQPEEPVRGRDAEPSPVNGRETDEFARHLADGARRVRDRLTTYVESDASRSTSPAAPLPPTEDELPPPRTSAFSVLRSKSSRGSLASRSRERSSRSRSRPAKGLGLKSTDPSSPPARPSVDGHNEPSAAPRKQSGEHTPDKDDNAHAGLKAFRQARRELQRMKEQEIRQRRGNAIPSAPTSAPPPPPPQARERSSDLSERGPPPVMYNRMPSGESGSRAPSERDRSGSEASNGGHPQYRPRLRTGSSAYDHQRPNSPGYHQRPSTDSRRSPMMAPYSSHSDALPGGSSRPGSAAGHFPAANSTPNLPTSGSVPPPLPPINPRRKGMGSPLPRDEDMPGSAGSGRMMSPDKGRSMKSPMMSDSESGVSHRQRLRKATSEGNGMASRSRPPPPPQSTMPDTSQPGGMF